ncbi:MULTISPECIES: hypothetical protein [unclassified Streptomyces]|uniref:hypothetical protein n=1 Tax=unclassified Streptomyces TaxID=2593676 RepID=UPI0033222F86
MQTVRPGVDAASFTADLHRLELKARIGRTAEGCTRGCWRGRRLRSAHHLHPDHLDQAFTTSQPSPPYAAGQARSAINGLRAGHMYGEDCEHTSLVWLLHAQSPLLAGVTVLFAEDLWSPAPQGRYYEEYADEPARAHPDWPSAELRSAASRYVSPPEIAPHSAGAAVDVTLVDHQGRKLIMGTRVHAFPQDSVRGERGEGRRGGGPGRPARRCPGRGRRGVLDALAALARTDGG